MKLRRVQIDWIDANTDNGWMGLSEAKKQVLAQATTIGFLVAETEAKVIVASSICDDMVNGITVIPRGWATIKDLP